MSISLFSNIVACVSDGNIGELSLISLRRTCTSAYPTSPVPLLSIACTINFQTGTPFGGSRSAGCTNSTRPV